MNYKDVLPIVIFFCSSTSSGQRIFEIKDASKKYNVQMEVAKCEAETCEGKAKFTLFKKGERRPFQIFELANTSFLLNDDKTPPVNKTVLYDQQSVINFGDYNFDGMEDLALCDGTHGGYGMPSYQIYLFSPRRNQFVRNPALTKLVQGSNLGMFEVEAKRRILRTYEKSGCCYHISREFTVITNSPKKILEIIEDARGPDKKKVKVTTRRLVKGSWRTSVRYEPIASQ